MQFVSEFIYCGCSRYQFKADDGRQLSGTKVDVIPLDSRKGEDVIGYEAIKLNAPYPLFEVLYKCKPLDRIRFEVELELGSARTRLRILAIAADKAS